MSELVAPKPEDLPGGRARQEQMKQEVLDALFGVEPQRTVGRYRLESLVGAGAMGRVYLARDDELDRSVAIKILTTGAGGLAEEPSERGKRIARVLREAQAMASLDHPNVVRVFDVGFSDETPYIVMEYVDGPTLSRWMRAAERTPAEVLRVFVEAGRGLAAAHALGMVHRDFKPSNVLLDPEGHARVTDFGLARTAAADLASTENSGPSGPLEASLTGAGMVIGTPAYMAPEQHVGHAVTAAADQYAFCVALFEALHGWRPFDAPNYRALVAQKRAGAVSRPSPTLRTIAAIDRVIERGLSPKPEDRWPSMHALLRALQPRRPRRVAAWVGAAAVIVGAAALGGASSPSPCTDLEASTIAWSDSMPIRGQIDDATWTRLDAAITEAIAGWRATVEEVCASGADAQPDVQIACLTEHRDHLASTIAALNAMEGVGAQSLVVASSLPGAHRCVEVDPETEPSPPPPENVARLRQLQDELVRARARTVAMSDRTDLDTASELVARAREIGYAPTLAAALRERSACESALGQVEAAVASAEEAYFMALRANALREALQAAIVLINLVGAHAADPEGGRTWEQHARALQQRVHEPSLEAALLRAVGHIDWQAGRFAEAKAGYERALAILRGDPTSSVMEQAQLLHNIGDAEETLGDAAAGRAKFREVMAIEAEVLGEDHVQVARTEGGIGLSFRAEGRYDEAVAILSRTAAAHERAYGGHHPEVARWLANLGTTRLGAGRYAEARADLQRAISIYEETDHLDLPMHRLNLAMVENALGHRDEARALLERAIDELEREHAHDTHLAMALNNLGLVESDSGRFEAAVGHHERALALKIAALGEHPSVARSHNNVALALIELGRYPEAREHLRAALRIVERGVSVPMDFEPQLRRLLADVALREGDAVLARTELDAASRLAEACSNHECAEEREKLAEVRRRLAARSRARARTDGA